MPNCKSTWHSAVVSDEAGHVYVLVVNAQVLHAAHELTVADREVLREFGDPSEEKGAGQVQGSKKTKQPQMFSHFRVLLCFYIINTNGGLGHEKFITERLMLRYFFPLEMKTENKDEHP